MGKIKGIIAAAIVVAIIVSPLVYNAAAGFDGEAPQLLLPKEGECVRPAEWMRDNHMQFLLDVRDQVVREGVRVANHGLQGCRSCHHDRGAFCDRCHGFVGVEPECWNCHFYPSSTEKLSGGDHEGSQM